MGLFYVYCMCQMCKKKKFIVSLFIVSELCVYFYIVNVLITIRMLFLGGNLVNIKGEKIAIVLYENVLYTSFFCHYSMLFYDFEKHEKAWILICMFRISVAYNVRNQFTAFCTDVWGSSGMQLVYLMEKYGPFFCPLLRTS